MKEKILFADSRIPHAFLGAGFPRANKMLNNLNQLGYDVAFYPLKEDDLDKQYPHHLDISPNITFISGEQYRKAGIANYLSEHAGNFNYILISRPTNMVYIKPIIEGLAQNLGNVTIIYDAEAIYALREIRERKIKGIPLSDEESESKIQNELSICTTADKIIAVSEFEKHKFIEHGIDPSKVYVLGHCVNLKEGENGFDSRKDILFVGSFLNDNAPNTDSILWFTQNVLPDLQANIKDISLNVVGLTGSPKVQALADGQVKIHGIVKDVEYMYNHSKIFIAPTRYAAGIPLKIIEAASMGIPIVTTSLIASLVGWDDGQELLVADDPKEFAQKCIDLYTNSTLWNAIAANAKQKVALEYSEEKFNDSLRKIFS